MFARTKMNVMRFASLAVMLCLGATLAQGDAVPVIEHAPVRTAAPGQNVTVRARITGPGPTSVSLFFATSKDAAPFKLPMAISGPGIYAGTISESMLSRLSEVYYYIEARDAQDAPVETPWYTIQIRAPTGTTGGAAGAAKSTTAETKKSSWVKPALIGGGILAAGGIAYAASSGSGGGGDDDGGGGSTTSSYAGVYKGSDTSCFQPSGGSPACEASVLTITITEQGVVQSDDLHTGQQLEAVLSGNSFVMVADVSDADVSGEIQYLGTVVDRRIVGSIQGSTSSAAGVGVFSGSFSAVR